MRSMSTSKSPKRLPHISSPASELTPVMFPPGCAKLLTRPSATGSLTSPTIGIVAVAALKYRTIRFEAAKTTSGCWRTTSLASSA
jgi:hypothetical protein